MPSSRDHRIARELLDIEKDKDNSGVFAHSVDGVRLDRLKGSFPGPPDTPYATGTFVVNITVPEQYPFKAPEIRFETRVWHPNISSQTDAEVASMLLGNPEQFKLVAHDWAVRYAGATRVLPQPGTLGPFQTPSPAVDPRSYAGYNKNLVDRFADMGFSVASVVAAFTQLGVDRRDGRDYEMEPGLIGDVTSCLFNE
ncbi:ubiquitin-conjugating enzyme (huntingtin interacting protein 2) [Sporothrix brasiliensis 5110]|uniref:Ubiquitin-conjugating enzyme (Huntingtin interacting protein 2) n=1 Tax=Sporothrix brasiliensis 5110 TaxID=1398154 RepID=A0A0C2FLU2_9PEZI|nr:ubiquitin-conjugating enzyme (huntingtin interacting protein 2) [Sporothrix brasiliensis 5110]KIH92043.1 ubiquitin-conjugating enzyme (huntingtin interacting protein 2) [Sporothrix brasiliensis 5110]